LADKFWSGVSFLDMELRGALPNTPLGLVRLQGVKSLGCLNTSRYWVEPPAATQPLWGLSSLLALPFLVRLGTGID
jgi:hypothetical protein